MAIDGWIETASPGSKRWLHLMGYDVFDATFAPLAKKLKLTGIPQIGDQGYWLDHASLQVLIAELLVLKEFCLANSADEPKAYAWELEKIDYLLDELRPFENDQDVSGLID